jgi:hypothetical protein
MTALVGIYLDPATETTGFHLFVDGQYVSTVEEPRWSLIARCIESELLRNGVPPTSDKAKLVYLGLIADTSIGGVAKRLGAA